MISRREMLRNLGYAAGAVTLLKLVPDFGGMDIQASALNPTPFETAMSFFESEFGDNNFEWIGETQMLSPEAALLELHKLHQLNVLFSNNVNYREGSQCTTNFRECEKDWRAANINFFTPVQRSKQDSDVAYLLGGNYDYNAKAWAHFYGATQFRDNPAVRLTGTHPSILAAATHTFAENYRPQPKEIAQSATLIADPQSIMTEKRVWLGSKYSTPKTEIIHYAPAVRTQQRVYNKGYIGIRRKNVPGDKWKMKGLYV
jgi:hypothetical protein